MLISIAYFGALFVLAVLLAVGLFVSMFVPPLVMTGVVAASVTFQFFLLPVAGIFLSVGFVSSWLLWPTTKELLSLKGIPKLWLMLGIILLVVQAISLLWAPEVFQGVRHLAFCMPFFFVLAAFLRFSRERPEFIERCFYILFMTALVNGILVILFWLSPRLESAYIYSFFSRIANSSNAISLVGDPRSGTTIADPSKSGGLYLNPNVSAVFNGVLGLVALYWRYGKQRIVRPIGALLLASVFFSGSKAAVALAVLIPTLLWLVAAMKSLALRVSPVYVVGVLVVVALTVVVGYGFIDIQKFERYLNASESTLNSRQAIWVFALEEFNRIPFTGHGFGGWSKNFFSYALAMNVNPNFPPHNSLIILWTQSGILAPLLGLAFQFAILYWLVNGFLTAKSPASTQYFLGLLGADLWYLIQGFGENYGILGEPHLSIALAMFFGFGLALQRAESEAKLEQKFNRETYAPQ
jgi:O-antigen ligase